MITRSVGVKIEGHSFRTNHIESHVVKNIITVSYNSGRVKSKLSFLQAVGPL
jgi:hypothetical protein